VSEYRNRTTGVVKTQGQWRSEFPNTSLPRVWTAATLDFLDLDPVLSSPKATTGPYQVSVRDGEEQDSEGNWIQRYVARDMFQDDPDLGTKAEQEAAYQADLDAKLGERHRTTRNQLLAETDFYALSDVTMPADVTTYRQALRDLPEHANWPNLDDADWPTKP
jgi:hypothetical protein